MREITIANKASSKICSFTNDNTNEYRKTMEIKRWW